MPACPSRRAPRLVAALLALWMLLAPPGQALAAKAQVAPAAISANGWEFVDVARVGQAGFTRLVTGRAGPDGTAVVYGDRNGETGLFRIAGATVTEVAIDNAELPGGLGTVRDLAAYGSYYEVLPNGDVLFQANVSNGSLSPGTFYTFRWSAGTISVEAPSEGVIEDTIQQAFGHDLDQVTSDNRWLTTIDSGPSSGRTRAYALTTGVLPTSPLFSFTQTSANCVSETRPAVGANAGGVAAYYEVQDTSTPGKDAFNNPICLGPTQRVWSVKLAGAAGGTLASGTAFLDGNTGSGSDLSSTSYSPLFLNNLNQVLAVRRVYDGASPFNPRLQLVRFQQGSEQILQDTDGQVATIFHADFDDTGRALYQAGLDDNVTTSLLVGPNLETDRVVRTGDTLFTKTVTGLSLTTRPALTGAPITDGFAFLYTLDGGAIGVALARKLPPRWTNAAGGAWGTAANWTPAAVPAASAQVTFGPAAAYTVQVGPRTIGSVAVEQGNVRFVSAELQVGTDGALAVAGSANGPVPRLTIGQGRAGAGAQQYESGVAANISVGPGELVLTNAGVAARSTAGFAGYAELGVLGPATATVTGGSEWGVQSLMVGTTAPALLRVEDGGWIRPLSGEPLVDEFWIGGSAGSSGTANPPATVRVDGASGNAGPHGLGSSIGPVEQLVVGQRRPGSLTIVGGGSVFAITTTVGTRDHGALVDGTLTVDGINTVQPSRLEAGRDVLNDGGLFVATATGTRAEVNIFNGGQVTATQLLLASGPQSSALMFVDGLEPTDVIDQSTGRSALYAPFPPPAGLPQATNPAAGVCVIGHRGRGTLNVSNGGLVQCHQIVVGLGPGSRGEVNIGSALGAIRPTVAAVGTTSDVFETGRGLVCIGRVARCGSTTGTVRGDVALGADGVLEAAAVAVGPGGRILGNGTVIATLGVNTIGGTLAPGVFVSEGTAAQAAQVEESEAALAPSAGTLTIQGNLTLSSTSVISMEVLGPAAAQQDRIVVSGAATLAGTLLVQFANGYVPAQGDQFAFIQAGSITGSFGAVTVSGLPAGFKVSVSSANGALTLTITDDGDPSTPGNTRTVYLPMVNR